MDRARKVFLTVIIGVQSPQRDMFHVSYIQEQIDFAFMVRSVDALRGRLDSDRLAIFDAIMSEEI